MGVDTGAYKKFRIIEEKEIIFEEDYDDVEGTYLKYPNAEFVELADAIEKVSEGVIDLRKHLIYEDVDYRKNDYSRMIKQLESFSFKDALTDGNRAKEFLETHYEEVKKVYRYILDPKEVLDYLVDLWEKGYYIDYSY